MTPAKVAFTYAAALDDGSLYVAGIARELEDDDVRHTLLWERVAGTWNRYQWRNRSYGLAAHLDTEGATALYLGYEGTLKVRSTVHGSREEIVDGGDDAPSSLRTVSSIRIVGDHLFLCGMRRMIYRRPLRGGAWVRFDEGVRQSRTDLAIAGLYAIDGHDPQRLYAVGIGGEIWEYAATAWRRTHSPTQLTLLAVRCLPGGRVVAGGERGALWTHDGAAWTQVTHAVPDETFSCIECWRDRCFTASETGAVYELTLEGTPTLTPFAVQDMRSAAWIFSTSRRVWFAGGTTVMSLGDDGWRDESPPPALVT